MALELVSEEPERKKRQLNGHGGSPPAKKSAGEEKRLDPGMLQFQNQKLSQQLEVQREEIQSLEKRIKDLRGKQAHYDDTLLVVNRAWNQLVQELELLTVQADANTLGLQILEGKDGFEEGERQDEPVTGDNLLKRLTKAGSLVGTEEPSSLDVALQQRSGTTTKVLECLIKAIEAQRRRHDQCMATLEDKVTASDVAEVVQVQHKQLEAEVAAARAAVDAIHVRHKEVLCEVAHLKDTSAKSQMERTRLADELEDTLLELEQARRKMASVSAQKNGILWEGSVSGPTAPGSSGKPESGVHQGNQSADSELPPGDVQMALEKAQQLAARRLGELEEAHQAHVKLQQHISQLEVAVRDEKRTHSVQAYRALSEKVHHLQGELEHYRTVVEQLQARHNAPDCLLHLHVLAAVFLLRSPPLAVFSYHCMLLEPWQHERDSAVLREREMKYKVDASDADRITGHIAEARLVEVEAKCRQLMADREELLFRLEEAHKAAGNKETVAEMKSLQATLMKELNMISEQLKVYKKAAQDVHSLKAETHSLRSVFERKVAEYEELLTAHNLQAAQVKAAREEVKQLKLNEQELHLFIEMFGRESPESRTVVELREAEQRALAQVEMLKAALNQDNLELQAKQAQESEKACQEHLVALETKLGKLQERLDFAERREFEMRENIKAKNEESETYVAEIETIGQAYEEMQAQNHRLMQQILQKDGENMQLMSESMKAKQMQSALLVEREALESRSKHLDATAEVHKQHVARLEEQARATFEQLVKTAEESRQHKVVLEAVKRSAEDAERDSLRNKAEVERVREELENRDRILAERSAEAEKERQVVPDMVACLPWLSCRFKRKRVEEEADRLKEKVLRLGGQDSRGSTVELLLEEIKEYKSILKCGVCHDRPKEVVITKCYHLFCSPCIQRNLEIRHRKCPGCNVAFGANDVHPVYI
eukprot:SM000017S02765  [mRNA]  locus=s17:155741:161803:+ [translate_table: standard]